MQDEGNNTEEEHPEATMRVSVHRGSTRAFMEIISESDRLRSIERWRDRCWITGGVLFGATGGMIINGPVREIALLWAFAVSSALLNLGCIYLTRFHSEGRMALNALIEHAAKGGSDE